MKKSFLTDVSKKIILSSVLFLVALFIVSCRFGQDDPSLTEYYLRGAYKPVLEIPSFRHEAENSDAFIKIGYRYYDDKDYEDAFRWFSKSAYQNNGYSECLVAYMYSLGIGIKLNQKNALKHYHKSAELDNPYGQYNLAYYYSEGDKIARDYNDANCSIWNSVEPLNIKTNLEESEKWYLRAAENSYVPAQNKIAYLWASCSKNLDTAEKYARTAVKAEPSNGEYADTLGWVLYTKGAYKESADELERALKLMPGEPIVQDHLGDAFFKLARPDKAIEMWKAALSTKDAALVKKIKLKIENAEH